MGWRAYIWGQFKNLGSNLGGKYQILGYRTEDAVWQLRNSLWVNKIKAMLYRAENKSSVSVAQ